MARRHRRILAKLDPIAVRRYGITEKELVTIERYLKLIQRDYGAPLTWQEIIDTSGPYATSIIVHELIETRLLVSRNIDILKLSTDELQEALAENIDAHITAVYEEHQFLQEYLMRVHNHHFEIATILAANRHDQDDLELFLESDIGIFNLENERIDEARQLLRELRGETDEN